MTGWRLLLTRPADECALLEGSLADAGVSSMSMPLLSIEPLPVSQQMRHIIHELYRYCAVIVVSKPAARLGLEMLDEVWPQPPIQTWFGVGAGTARILDDYGLKVFHPGDREDSEGLLGMPELAEALRCPDPRVLIMRGEGGREMLAEQLRGKGAVVDYLELYRRCLLDYAPGELVERVKAERLNGLVVSSGQGFEHLLRLAGEAWPRLARLPLFVPGARVADMARAAGANTIVECRGASAAALLAALREHPRAASQVM